MYEPNRKMQIVSYLPIVIAVARVPVIDGESQNGQVLRCEYGLQVGIEV